MRPDMVALYRKVRDIHHEVHVATEQFKQSASRITDPGDGADCAYVLNECYKFLDDSRKSIKNAKELAERVTCLILVTQGNGGNVKTDYCTATPRASQIASIPKRSTNPVGYAALMNHLGIPRALWDREEEDEVVRPHWPGMVAYLSQQLAAGKPLPPGIDPDKTYAVYSLTIRAKKGVTADPETA